MTHVVVTRTSSWTPTAVQGRDGSTATFHGTPQRMFVYAKPEGTNTITSLLLSGSGTCDCRRLKPGITGGGVPTILDGKLFLLRGSGKTREFDGRMGTEMKNAVNSLDAQAYVGVCNKMLKEIALSKGLE